MDHYYKIGSTNIHWAQIVTSVVCVSFLGSVVFIILSYGLNRDFKGLKAEALARAQRRKARLQGQQMEIDSSEAPARAKTSAVPWKKLYG
mmetsp:Transcript_32881/g.40649  ORF Transcript_32881/g.40649 Transcript_32881/m.40649 type:complete len:90 (+) Transcript_32881:725-994(+)